MANVLDRPDTSSLNLERLRTVFEPMSFSAGTVLREKGQHYRDMYLILDGRIDVRRGEGAAGSIQLGPGTPIGEIGFIHGCRASADVVALTDTTALVVRDEDLWRLEREEPALAIALCRFLATVSAERLASNAELPADLAAADSIRLDVLLCRDDKMLEEAMRLRYAVYCEELGRTSPYADHEKAIIRDALDDFGYTFIAKRDGETLGTIRANFANKGDLGILEELYGMRTSPHHPGLTSICTKFIVKKSVRGGPASMHLVTAAAQFGMRHEIVQCFIDCIPPLKPFYEKFGFKSSGEPFFHYENGPSWPMALDLSVLGTKLNEMRP